MPAKVKGLTSLEIAIIVAIILIIAVAVGWYLYTTFTASATGQPRLSVVKAEIKAYPAPELKIRLVNPGPVRLEIANIEVAGVSPTTMSCSGGLVVDVGYETECTVVYGSGSLTATPGTMLAGRVILRGGHSFPFNALVVP